MIKVTRFMSDEAQGVKCVRAEDFDRVSAELAVMKHPMNSLSMMRKECGALQARIAELEVIEKLYEEQCRALSTNQPIISKCGEGDA